MKIVAINGSPHGSEGVTNLLVSTFLKGAQDAGAETVNIILTEKEINHCTGCRSCLLVTPGECIFHDDMAGIIAQGQGADILVLATPVKYANLSSRLKVFIERMLFLINPYLAVNPATGLSRHPRKIAEAEKGMSFHRARLLMIAVGGFPDRGPNFQIISDWLQRLAFYNHTEVIGEIYTSKALLFCRYTSAYQMDSIAQELEEYKPLTDNYLRYMEKAGNEIVTLGRLSTDTQRVLDQDFIPNDIYDQRVLNLFFDQFLSKLEQHPYMKA